MARESSRDLTARLKVAGAVLFRGDLKAAEQAVKDLNKETAKGSATSRRAAKDVDTHRKAIDLLGRSAVRAGRITLLTGAVSALGGEAIVAVGGIGSLAGALSALPAVALGAISSLGVLKLAFSGLGDAVKAIGDPTTSVAQMKKALAGLSPQAVSFARQLAGAQGQIKGLRTDAQNALFPGLSAGLRAGLPGLLPIARTGVRGVGAALGRGGQILGQTLATRGVRSDLRTTVLGNNASLATLTRGVAPATQTLARLAATLAPIEQSLARATVRGLQFVNVWTSGHTTQIRSFFEHGLHDAKEFAIGLGHLATAIGHVFGASRQANGGADIFDGFASLTKQLSTWTGSAHGQTQITTFFTKVRDTVHDIGPGVGHIAEDLIKLGNSLSTGPFAFGVGLLSKFADLIAGLPGPIRTALVTSAGIAYVGSKVGAGGIVGKLLSKAPVIGSVIGTSGALGTQNNPMWVRVVGSGGGGSDGSGGGAGGTGSGIVRHAIEGAGARLAARVAARVGLGASAGSLLLTSGDSGSKWVDPKRPMSYRFDPETGQYLVRYNSPGHPLGGMYLTDKNDPSHASRLAAAFQLGGQGRGVAALGGSRSPDFTIGDLQRAATVNALRAASGVGMGAGVTVRRSSRSPDLPAAFTPEGGGQADNGAALASMIAGAIVSALRSRPLEGVISAKQVATATALANDRAAGNR